MMDGTALMGQLSLLAQQAFKLRFFWASLGLVGALLLGAIVIALVERWRKRSSSEGLTAGDQLTHFRELYSRGEITREEFEQIRGRLAGELRKEMNLEPAPTPAGPSQATSEPVGTEMTLPQPPPQDGPGS